MAEFWQLDRANAEAKKEITGIRLPAYNAPAKAAIDLALPWHSSTVQIAARNHDIVLGRLAKYIEASDSSKALGSQRFLYGR